jgi:hypothetical protein
MLGLHRSDFMATDLMMNGLVANDPMMSDLLANDLLTKDLLAMPRQGIAATPRASRQPPLERFPAKWNPVRVKKTRHIKNREPRSDSIGTEKALARTARGVRSSPPTIPRC